MINHIEKIRREMRQMRRLIEAHNRASTGPGYDPDHDATLLYVDLASEVVNEELHAMLKESK